MKTNQNKPEPIDATLRKLAGYNLKRVYLLVREAVLDELSVFGLRPPSFSALVIVCDCADLSQSELAEALSIKRSGMVVIVDELEQAGLISRNPVPGDRRSYALRATLKGMRVRGQALAAVERAEANVLAALNASEQKLLSELFQRISRGNSDSLTRQERKR